MYSKFFVGATYQGDTLLSRKIDGFRSRFDPKFRPDLSPHLALLAPFEMHKKQTEDLVQNLQEEIDSFFYGEESSPSITIQGVGIHSSNRKNILYLNPVLNENLQYCMDSIQEICKAHMPPNIPYHPNKKQFMPLGRFSEWESLDEVMNQAKAEFHSSGELEISSIVLFEKKFGIWTPQYEFISFEKQLPLLNLAY